MQGDTRVRAHAPIKEVTAERIQIFEESLKETGGNNELLQ